MNIKINFKKVKKRVNKDKNKKGCIFDIPIHEI